MGIVVPLVFAFFFEVVGSSRGALFAAFSAFSLLAFADFGGSQRDRATADGLLTLVGAVLVTIGTALSRGAIPAAIVGLVVAAVARFVGCFGGYYRASVSAVILPYVLGATVPGPIDTVWIRIVGWIVGGVVATIASLVLWPRRERLVIRAAAADLADALGDAVPALALPGGIPPDVFSRARVAWQALHEREAIRPRSAGPSAHDAALNFLHQELDRLWVVVNLPGFERLAADEAEMADLAGRILHEAASTLRSGAAPVRLDDMLDQAVRLRRRVIAGGIEQLTEGTITPDAELTALDDSFRLRLALYLAGSVLANASIIVAGAESVESEDIEPLEVPETEGTTSAMRRLAELARAHAVPSSAWAQDAARAGLSIGVAIFIANVLRLDHAFWVVLGTLSVLRSNAFDTGRTSMRAALGTGLGFALTGVTALVPFPTWALWMVLVAGFFLAAYLPSAVGFVAGQAAFTIAVIALINLLEPAGIHTGLVRVQDIAIGVAVSTLVALLFWPRRAVVNLRATVASLYREVGQALLPAVSRSADEARIFDAELRARAAYDAFLEERSRPSGGRQPWSRLLVIAAQARACVEFLDAWDRQEPGELCRETEAALDEAAQAVGTQLERVADRLEHPASTSTPFDLERFRARTREPIAACLDEHLHDEGAGVAVQGAITRDWFLDVAELAEQAVDLAGAVSR
ncbi:MAG TPA: FUSC family protein [Acidimicrobiia bacterium]